MEEQALQTLRYGRMPQANELHASGKQQEHVGESLPVHEAITYLENHGERMGDAHARQRGLPIGSGTVEAPCKSFVALLMKRPGARWKHPSGQHILDLRALVLSDRWSHAMPLVVAWCMPASLRANGKRGRPGPIAPAWSPLTPVAARPGGARLERNGVGLRCHSGMTAA